MASAPSSRPPFPGWESSWRLCPQSSLPAGFRPMVGTVVCLRRLHPSLPPAHISAPPEAGAAAPTCPTQGWFKALVHSKAQLLWLCHIHGGHGCLAGPEVPGKLSFPRIRVHIHGQRKKSHMSSAREGEFLGRLALRCLRTWVSPRENGDGRPIWVSSAQPRPQVHPSPSHARTQTHPRKLWHDFSQMYFQECSPLSPAVREREGNAPILMPKEMGVGSVS